MTTQIRPSVLWGFISIFGVAIITFIFWAGVELGTVKTKLRFHETLPMHDGTRKTFVPRAEHEIRWDAFEQRLNEINNDLKEIKQDLKVIKNGYGK